MKNENRNKKNGKRENFISSNSIKFIRNENVFNGEMK